MSGTEIFEVEIDDVYHYRLSYGGQSPYFHGLQRRELIGSRCTGCGFCWLPLRPICSKCYAESEQLVLSGKGEILTTIMLPNAPEHLKHLGRRVATALIKPDGADTCIKAFVVGKDAYFEKGTRVSAEFLPKIRTIGDFYFTPD
ncbi:hypothetical protein C8J36_11619 [Rhizobium sp. PP-F2F-G48]|uniref:Zn-ribbon domain-containing OB-fold protein n=1 Tax=Rhizobium sp. PP-F2F-G48 TaxID=2135651 RepID=UPI00104350EC|nr:hypothetical protein [Rhizobium sp. PP-F2F-G48]TCM47204.1 hypothetical protein C8J36_11619 [Rhizobium sp. PP-F2F-G48]